MWHGDAARKPRRRGALADARGHAAGARPPGRGCGRVGRARALDPPGHQRLRDDLRRVPGARPEGARARRACSTPT